MSEIQKLVHKLLQTVVKYNSIISLNVGRTPPTPTTPMPEVLVVGLKGPTSGAEGCSPRKKAAIFLVKYKFKSHIIVTVELHPPSPALPHVLPLQTLVPA